MNVTYEIWRDYVTDGQSLLPYDRWVEDTNLCRLWDQRIKSDDPRWVSSGGNVDVFVRTVYNWLDTHLDTFLRSVYNSAFEDRSWRPLDTVTLINENDIANVANNPSYFRNRCYRDILVCGGDGDSSLSIKDAIVATLQGRVRKTFTMPAIWQDIVDGTVSSNMVLTFNKSCKLASIFSPNVYRYLLRRMRRHDRSSGSSILFATASWGVPVIAARDCNYSVVDIVDVQRGVLDVCHQIHSEAIASDNQLFVDDYTLGTYCTPSEVMSTVLPRKYSHIISCPPYYDLEMYGGSDQQSTTLYTSYGDWLEGYWRQTVLNSIRVLESGGVYAFVMGHNVRYQLMARDMAEIATQCGLQEVDEVRIMPKRKTDRIYLSPTEKWEACKYFVLNGEQS